MATPSWREELPKRVRAMQIIITALTLGCVFFFGIAFFVASSMPQNTGSNLITYIALGFAVLAIGPRLVVPLVMVSAGRRKILHVLQEKKGDTQSKGFENLEDEAGCQLLAIFQGKTIISGALIEGPTFFLLVAYLVEHSPLALAAAGIMVVILALHFPTVDRTANWIEGQLQLLKEEY
jgi:hypothetical protein